MPPHCAHSGRLALSAPEEEDDKEEEVEDKLEEGLDGAWLLGLRELGGSGELCACEGEGEDESEVAAEAEVDPEPVCTVYT